MSVLLTLRCGPGAVENRLRRRAGELSATYAQEETPTSADGRLPLSPRLSSADPCVVGCDARLPRCPAMGPPFDVTVVEQLLKGAGLIAGG